MTVGREPSDNRHTGLEIIPGHNGASAELGGDEYIELYRDFNNRLSSAVWSTDIDAERLIEDAESLIGMPNSDKRAGARFKEPHVFEEMAAREVKPFLRQNIGRVAWCRVDFGTHSIIWTSVSEASSEEERFDRAAAIFKTSEPEKTVRLMERTGTVSVRQNATRLIPDLSQAVENLIK